MQIQLSNELKQKLSERLKLATIPQVDLNLGHIRLVLRLVLKWPKYLNDVPLLLQDAKLECSLPQPNPEQKDCVFSFSQSMLIQELAYQVYRALRFGREYQDTRPYFDWQLVLALTLEEAKKIYG